MGVYRCAGCGTAVIVLPDEEPIRGCACDAPIVAEASASCSGSGGFVEGGR